MSDWFKTLNRKNTDSIKWRLAEEKCQGRECYTFSIADSDYQTAPVIKKALLDRVKHGAFGYAGRGEDYEDIIISWYKKRYDVNITKKSIIPVPTVLNALSVVIDKLSNINDDIIIQTPVYHVFKPVIEANQRHVLESPLGLEDLQYKMDFKHIEKLFKNGSKTFVLCNPHNPVGRVWTEKELKTLVDLAKKYQVLLISDEIHSDIIMPGYKFTSLGTYFHIYDKIIVISAPTKVFNIAGLQIAQIIVENESINEILKDEYMRLHLTTPNLLALTALKTAYKDGFKWLKAQNKHIQANYEYMKSYLHQYNNLFLVFPLEGTYLSWIKVNIKGLNAKDLVDELMKYGVFLSEGDKFGNGEDFVRASLACSKEQLITGLEKLTIYLRDKNII
ncbi:aminotransferase class I/II-fold pyridoxal phosphate-dependent enzyme [Mycoplasmatota bacterium]|nr:aminotransferase class I/II-fold pyridoxal phosphate-dependent enzyme [Mycoplasmatota bacterium]